VRAARKAVVKAHFSREVVARFDGGTISSDGGALLLRETDRRLNLLPRLADCFLDGRNQQLVKHSVQEMDSQRIYGLALGYEDLNDHEQLRRDPLMGVLAGKPDVEEEAPAGKSTLNRLELIDGTPNRYKKITLWKPAIDELLVSVFLEPQQRALEEIILDVDTTDLPLHGEQEGRFFHGYYDCYCYLPLYIFCGEHVLSARLRQSNSDASADGLVETERVVTQIRVAWPEVKILRRADSGFCRNELMSWRENHQVDCVFGLARNKRLRRIIGRQMREASEQWNQTGKPARAFTEFGYQVKKTKKSGWDLTISTLVLRLIGTTSLSRTVPVVREACGGQGRAYRWQRESPVYHHVTEQRSMGGSSALRRLVLRSRGYGEPHQGAVRLVCGPRECRDDARQSMRLCGIRVGKRGCAGWD